MLSRSLTFILLFAIVLRIHAQSSATKSQITNIPGFTGTLPSMYAGYLPVRNGDANLYYILVEAASNKETAPLIIFMNGGPGCSSLVQLFYENGPFNLVDSNTVAASPQSQSWNEFANVLYLDQPIGAGFSYVVENANLPSDSKTAAKDVFDGLVQYFALFPAHKTSRVYFSGVGYAAKIISYLVTYAKDNNATLPLDIRGMSLGNAMIRPSVQYGSYANFGYAAGIISYRERVEINKQYEKCLQDIQSENYKAAAEQSCQPLFDKIISASGNIDPFDVRKLVSDLSAQDAILTYMKRVDVRNALVVSPKASFHKCNSKVAEQFLTKEFHSDLPELIIPNIVDNYKIHTLFYNGQFDLRCNTLGVQETLRQMMWSGREAFNQMSPTVFTIRGNTPQERIRGQFKTFGYLSHMVVYGGSRDDANNPQSIVTTFNLMKRFTSPTTTDPSVVMNSLCDSTEVPCATMAINCPNDCSGHGNCTTVNDVKTCKCANLWSGSDCSIGDFPYQIAFNSNTSYSAKMFGREAVVFKFVFNPSSSLLGLDIVLKTTSPTGTPFMFLNVTSKAAALTGPQIKHIARQQVEYHVLNGLNGYTLSEQVHGQLSGGYFQYYNVSHDRTKEIHIREIDILRGEDNVIAIAVFNYADVPCSFQIEISTTPDSGRVELFGLFVGLSLAFLVVIIIEIMVIMSRANNRAKLEESIRYSSQHRPIMHEEEDDEERQE